MHNFRFLAGTLYGEAEGDTWQVAAAGPARGNLVIPGGGRWRQAFHTGETKCHTARTALTCVMRPQTSALSDGEVAPSQ